MVTIASEIHLFPSRTQKLSPSTPMVLGGRLPGRVGRCQFESGSNAPAFLVLYAFLGYNSYTLWGCSGFDRDTD